MKSIKYIAIYGIVSLLFLLLIICYPFIIKIIYPVLNLPCVEKYGQLGDMYGIVNGFFSGITLIILIVSLLEERKGIKEEKSKTLEKDEIKKEYDNFMILLTNHLQVISDSSQADYSSKSCIAHSIYNLKNETLSSGNSMLDKGYQTTLRSYFRSLIIICEYINKSIHEENISIFIDLLSTQIIGNEIQVIDKILIDDDSRNALRLVLNKLKDNIIIEPNY